MKVLIAPIQKNKVDENGMRKDVASGELFAGSNVQLMVPLARSQVKILRLVWIHIVLRETRQKQQFWTVKIDDDQTEFREHNECIKNKLFVERGVNVERAEERNYLRHRLNDV